MVQQLLAILDLSLIHILQSVSKNPVFQRMMGVRYIVSDSDVPGYTLVKKCGTTGIYPVSYTHLIGMASRELQDEEKDKLDSQVIATDGIAVIVNKNNTTDELSSDQVKTIYTGDATTWDEVVK